jgi:hypothetical protein
MTYQEIVNAIESLPRSERDNLFQLIHNQQIPQNRIDTTERQQTEILDSVEQVPQLIETNAVKLGSADTKRDEKTIDAFDRDGHPFTYSIRDLFWSQDAYDYTKEQEKSFDLHMPELISKYAGKYVIFENGRVIDYDPNEDVLLDRISETSFFQEREGILCAFVPEARMSSTDDRLEING